VRVSPDVGIEEHGIGVDRHREHIRLFVEDSLRAVAMMHVDIEDRDPLMLQLKMSCRHRAIVQKAESPGDVAKGMVTGRPAQRVGRVFPVHDELGGGRGNIGRGAGRGPGSRTDRAPRIGRVPTEPADDVGRVRRGMADGMHIGDHFRTGIAERAPGLPRLLQKAKIFGAVNPRPRTLAETRRCDQIVLACLQSRQQPVGALRLLGGTLDHAAHQEELRIVAAMQFGIYGLHTVTPLVGNKIPPGCATTLPADGASSRTSLPTSRQA
jgi:hypothetical protein